MKQLRAETISAVDGRLSALQAQVAEAVDTRVAAALLPLTARLERIELLNQACRHLTCLYLNNNIISRIEIFVATKRST